MPNPVLYWTCISALMLTWLLSDWSIPTLCVMYIVLSHVLSKCTNCKRWYQCYFLRHWYLYPCRAAVSTGICSNRVTPHLISQIKFPALRREFICVMSCGAELDHIPVDATTPLSNNALSNAVSDSRDVWLCYGECIHSANNLSYLCILFVALTNQLPINSWLSL